MSGVAPEQACFALSLLRRLGIERYIVREKLLDCGCRTESGYRTDNGEVCAGIHSCDAHRSAAAYVLEHAFDPEVVAEVGEMEPTESLALLLSRRIEAQS